MKMNKHTEIDNMGYSFCWVIYTSNNNNSSSSSAKKKTLQESPFAAALQVTAPL